MIKREWKNFLHNWIRVIVMIVIIMIPSIYAGLFLASMWDPYGSLDNLPVAVINNDESVTYNGRVLKVGDDLVENMKDNSQLKFNFTDTETAARGLENGTYFMVITVPEDFSKNASTLMDDSPQKMQLDYEVNPGTNYIASKLSDTAVLKIQKEVNEKVSQTYAQSMFDNLKTIGSGMTEAADGATQINDGTKELAAGNDTIKTNLYTLASKSITFKDGAGTLAAGLSAYTDGVAQAASGAASAVAGADQLASGAQDAAAGTAAAAAGSDTIHKNMQTLAAGAATADTGAAALASGAASASTGAQRLSDGLSTMKAQLPALTAGIGSLNTGLNGAGGLKDGSQQFAAGLQALAAQLSGQGGTSSASLDALTAGSAQFKQGLDGAAASASESTQLTDKNTAEIAALTAVLSNPSSSLTADERTAVENAAGLLNASNDTISAMSTGLTGLSQSYAQLDAGIQQLKPLLAGLGSVQTAVTQLNDAYQTQINPGIIQTAAGTAQLASASTTLQAGADSLAAGASELSAGTSALNSGAQRLAAGNKALAGGASELSAGTNTLSAGLGALKTGTVALSNGTSVLASGARQLSGGLATLQANSAALLSGTAQLADGASQISAGSTQLADGSAQLGSGITQLDEGSQTLATSIADGAKDVNDIHATDDTTEMMAAPVTTNRTEMTSVANNGSGMAPYMMSVGLWVACMAFCIMYPITEYSGKLTNGLNWYMSKATVFALIATLMPCIMIWVLETFLGFDPKNLGMMYLIAIAASWAFMAIMYYFNALLGKVGAFIMLVYMVVQLAGSAGTYPVPISADFVAAIHPYIPFTYSVEGFRAAIAGGPAPTAALTVLLGITAAFTVLTVVLFQIRSKRIKEDKKTTISLLERFELM